MRVKTKRIYPLDVETIFNLWTDFDQQLEWMRLPDWLKLEQIKDDKGRIIGGASSRLVNDQWITTKTKNIYFKENEETRCLVTEISDQDGNDLLSHPCTPCKTIAIRSLFRKVDNGTEVTVEHHLEAKGITRIWDTLWLLPEYKKQTKFIMGLLYDFVSKED